MHTESEAEEATTLTDEQWLNLFRLSLGNSIKSAFTSASAMDLRKWYVDTFVLDPANVNLLGAMSSDNVPTLVRKYEASDWQTTEHAAMGHRLLYAIDPHRLFRRPDLLDPDTWRNEHDVAQTMMLLLKPWENVRFDPDGENWYLSISPGQWRRFGKGNPSDNMVEQEIERMMLRMDPTVAADLYIPYVPDEAELARWDTDTLAAKQAGVRTAFTKYRQSSMVLQRLREAFERHPIMHLDTSTLNKIRTIAPFNNGALTLVPTERIDTLGKVHEIPMGTLLPLDKEYMVTNANPLDWLDDGSIPKAANDYLAKQGDFVSLDNRQDELLFKDCPTYWSFLTHAFPDVDERLAFLRLLGAAMFGTNLKIVAAMIGEPNAGKDTVINWLTYLMPGQVATLPFSAFTPHGDDDRGFAPLLGARVATVSGEVGEGRGSKLLAEKIKTVSSGGGKIRVAEKYEKPTDIWFDGMLFLQGNSVPQIAGGDRALYTNRLVAVEFKHPFPLVSRSYEADYRAEAEYFVQVLFINYIQYVHAGGGMTGIDAPASWKAFANEFANASNQHGWLESCIVASKDPIPTTQFHSALSAMVSKFGSPFAVGPNYWPKRLRTLGFPLTGASSLRKQAMRAGKREWVYYLTLDAELSEGAFTQDQWERVLKDSAVVA